MIKLFFIILYDGLNLIVTQIATQMVQAWDEARGNEFSKNGYEDGR